MYRNQKSDFCVGYLESGQNIHEIIKIFQKIEKEYGEKLQLKISISNDCTDGIDVVYDSDDHTLYFRPY